MHCAVTPTDHARIPLVQLAWPLLVENVLRTSLMSVDTLMLSRYSSEAVAAMSLASQFGFFLQLLYTMGSIGSSVLITQNLGAGQKRTAGLYGVGSLTLILAASLVMSVLVALGGGLVIDLYRLDPQVARYARQFLTIYGGLSFFVAINIGQASILRAWGHARDPMLVNGLCLLLTVGGNALCLFGPFGFPVLGVPGVAASTIASQAVACVLSAWMIQRRGGLGLRFREAMHVPRHIYRSILAIGIPIAGESISYNLSQIAVLALLSGMGTAALSTYGIVMALLRYVFVAGVSIGSAGQIKVGYLVGAGHHDEASHRVYRYFATGFSISLALVLLLQIFHRPILGLFSQEPRVLGLAASVLVVAMVFEPGRSFNTIIIPALKGAGDVRFPVYVGIASMWGISVLGGWLLGVWLDLGLVGVWMAMAADEWLRGIAMLLRWRSGAWRRMALVGRAGAGEGAVASMAQLEVEEGV
ncbi:MAG TPA: MATE family efflux transporter [Kofleriaceae bacterium]|nr:MATE family efflux transporter [Kofleriaceae bacterium]